MDDIIYLKCPFDGSVLKVRRQPGIEQMNVPCPVCKHTYPFGKFRQVVPQAKKNVDDDDCTRYPGGGSARGGDDGCTRMGDTVIGPAGDSGPGKLKLAGTGQIFSLSPGRNVIGRRALHSNANFQIDTGVERRMSREHLVVDVKQVPGKGYVHSVSLYKAEVNPTFVGNERLLPGDHIILSAGTVINLPGAVLEFIP